MASQTCQGFCCSAFANYVDQELTGSEPDLTNDLLLLFRRSNFTGADGATLSRGDYDVLRPSLQLASLFLQSDPMTLFLVKLFDGELRTGNGILIPRENLMCDLPDGTQFQAWDVHATLPENQGEVNDQMRKRAADILTRMAEMVTFELKSDPEEAVNHEGTSTSVNAPLPAKLRQFFSWGQRSVIWIDDPVEKIKDALAHASQEDSKVHSDGCTPASRVLHREYLEDERTCNACSWPLELVAARFFMTKTVVHEILHSCRFASWGTKHLTYEIPQMLIAVGETGCEAWMAVVGGTPRITPDDRDNLDLEKIPGPCNEGKSQPKWGAPVGYLETWINHGILEHCGEVDLRPLHLEPHMRDDLYARIPLSYFEDLFTQGFWDRVAVAGPDAMKPPSVGSWYFKWKDEFGWTPCDGDENEGNVLFAKRLAQYEHGNLGPHSHGRSQLKRKRWNVGISPSDSSVRGRKEGEV